MAVLDEVQAWSTRARSALAQQLRSRVTVTTWLVNLLVLAGMLTATLVRTGEVEMPSPALAVAVVLAWLPLIVRTRRPVAALAATTVVEILILVFLAVPDQLADQTQGMGAYQPVPIASMVAAFSVAARTPRRVGWTLGCSAGAVLALVGVLTHDQATFLTDMVVFYLVATGTAIGALVAGRRDGRARRARDQQEATERAVLDERLRIARELHDVLAHNLTLVNAQAGVAAYLLDSQPKAAATALRDITSHTSRAIDELRATIGLLRGSDRVVDAASTIPPEGAMQPVPGLSSLGDLIGGFRTAGAQVDVTVGGAPGNLDRHGDIAAYRIIQEALTNAIKHAPDEPIQVSLVWSELSLTVRVVNPTRLSDARSRAPGTGHGLIGMHERAVAAGGDLCVGRLDDGRFEVLATLPVALASGETDPATARLQPSPAPAGASTSGERRAR